MAKCRHGWNLGSDAARAVGRFMPGGPYGYRARSLPYGPLRATRAEAEADQCDALGERPVMRPRDDDGPCEAATQTAQRDQLQAETEGTCRTCGHGLATAHDNDGECWKPDCGCISGLAL